MNGPSLAQQILICYDKILFCHTQRGYQFLFLDYYYYFFVVVILRLLIFYKNHFIIIILLYFFLENYFYFFMFRGVPGCSGMFRVLSTPIYYIHTEKYSPKSYVGNFRTQISSSQSKERTMVFTREKNDTSNQNRERCFFTCKKNDTSSQKPQKCVSCLLYTSPSPRD